MPASSGLVRVDCVKDGKEVIVKGSCLCGAIKYAVSRLDMPIIFCHCKTCKKAHAAPFNATAGVAKENFRWLQGRDKLASFESSPGKIRHFCSICGTHLVAEKPAQPHVILRVASLDEDPGVKPEAHIWTSHDVEWLQGEGIVAYKEGRLET